MLYIQFQNNLKKLAIGIIYILVFMLSYVAGASELVIGTYNLPPFSMREDGEDIGLATEAMQNLLIKSGITDFTISYYPVMRGLFELENNRIDIYYPYVDNFSKSSENFILIGPISRYRVALFVRKDYNKEVSLAAMRSTVVSAERGSIGDLLMAHLNIRVEQASQEISCLRMVIAHRVTACVMGTLPGMYSGAINNIYGEIRYVETDQFADIYIALRKNLPNETIDKIRKTFMSLKQANYFEIQQRDYENKFATFIKSLS